MKTKIITSIIICIILMCVCSYALPEKEYSENSKKIYSNTLRLHVIANSDSVYDQNLKLLVKNKIALLTQQLFQDCTTIEQACDVAKSNLDFLQKQAYNVIKQNGFDYSVKVTLTNEFYPVKSYGQLTFPSGKYNSLRVLIGASQGKNWWCVLYPPLCLDAATEHQISAKQAQTLLQSYGENAINLISQPDKNEKLIVKFKIVELLCKLGII